MAISAKMLAVLHKVDAARDAYFAGLRAKAAEERRRAAQAKKAAAKKKSQATGSGR
jgi:hypothetical protein